MARNPDEQNPDDTTIENPGRRAFLRTAGLAAAGAAAAAAVGALKEAEAGVEQQVIDGVPQFNARGQRRRVVEAAAARASHNSIVLIYYGTNPQVEGAARQAASELRGQQWPVRIILADGENTLQTYINGQPVTTFPNPPADSQSIRDMIVDSFNHYQQSVQMSALENTSQ